MKIRIQIHRNLLFALVMAMLLIWLQLRFQIAPVIQSVELQRMNTDRARLEDSMARELSRMESIATDWGFWDDTYEFTETPNEAYRQTNLQPLWLEQYQLDLLLVCPNGGIPDWIASPDLPFSPKDAAAIVTQGIEQARSGAFLVQGTPCFVAVCPIKGSDGRSPSQGFVMVLEVLDPDWAAQVGERFGAQIRIETSSTSPDTTKIRYLSANEMEISAAISFLNQPSEQLVLRLIEQRRIHPTLMSTSQSIAAWFFITVVVFMALVMLGLERSLIRPLLGIQSRLEEMAGPDVTRRVKAGDASSQLDYLALVNAYVTEAGKLVDEQKQELAKQRDYYQELSRERAELVENRERELAVAMEETLSAAETEARRIGEDIHDSLCQELVALSRMAESPPQHDDQASGGNASLMKRIQQQASSLAMQARAYAHRLAFSELEDQPLEDAIATLIRRNEVLFAAKVEMNIGAALPPLALEKREHIYRIIREAMHNAHRHARARNIWVDIVREPDALIFSITNDGDPLDEHRIPGLGMKQISMRARLLGGSFRLFTGDGRMTIAELIVPISADEIPKPCPSGRECDPGRTVA